MAKRYLLGIDNGGSIIKCVVFAADGRQVGSGGVTLPLISPAPGMTERGMEEVWDANVQAIRQAIGAAGIDLRDIAAVGLTGYGNGICFVDDDGAPTFNAVVSTDNRGQPFVTECRENGVEKQVYALTKQGLWSAQFASLLNWFARNQPEVLNKSACFFGIKDFIRLRLTGARCMEMTEASSSGLMNIDTLEWDDRLFDLVGAGGYRRLAPVCVGVCDTGNQVVTAEAEKATGIPAGTPVSGSCFDVDAGMLASGILDSHTLCMIAGTWSINEHLADKWDYGYGETPNSISMSFLPGHYLVEESTPTSAGNFDWFLEKLLLPDRPDMARRQIYAECDAAALDIGPEGSDVVFVPYLFASASHPDAKGAFFNLSSYHDRRHMLRAVYEGVVFSSVWHVRRLMTDGRGFDRARISGGLTNSPMWTQMMADALQLPLDVLASTELSAMGAAMCAGIGCGMFADFADATARMVRIDKTYRPDPALAEIYAAKFARYEKALAALDTFHSAQ
jgi:Sugar (pentulose and hexulose) kinases